MCKGPQVCTSLILLENSTRTTDKARKQGAGRRIPNSKARKSGQSGRGSAWGGASGRRAWPADSKGQVAGMRLPRKEVLADYFTLASF